MKKKYKIEFVSEKGLNLYVHRFFRFIVKTIQRYNLDGSGITIPGRFVETWGERTRKNIDPSIKKKLDYFIKKERSDLKSHFSQKNPWKLDLNYIQMNILDDTLGFLVTDYINSKLVKNMPLDLVVKNQKWYIIKRKQ